MHIYTHYIIYIYIIFKYTINYKIKNVPVKQFGMLIVVGIPYHIGKYCTTI